MAKRLMLFWLAGGLPLLSLVIWSRLPAGSSSFDQHSPAVVGTDEAVSVGAVTLWNEYEKNAVAAGDGDGRLGLDILDDQLDLRPAI